MLPLQTVPGGPIALIVAIAALIVVVIAVRIAVKLAVRVGIAVGAVLALLWLLGQVGVPVPVFGLL